jgi:hypothetical protein
MPFVGVDICRTVRSKLQARSSQQEFITSELQFNSLLRFFLLLIMTFQYCVTCRRQRRKSKAYDPDVWDPCNECFDRRQKYSDQLHRDRAYRSHLARQIAGYPCDTRSGCPHHPNDYPFFKYPRISFIENGYAELIKTAFAKLRRDRESNITALELLSAHYASLDEYCQTCYGNALDGFEDNADVGLCQNCHGKRNEFIKDNHGNQTEFKLPLERARFFPMTNTTLLFCMLIRTHLMAKNAKQTTTSRSIFSPL